AAIVGGGYIAVELAGVLAALGSDVEVFMRRDTLLRSFDPMLSTTLMECMQLDGIVLHPRSDVVALDGESGEVTVRTRDGESRGPYDAVFWAVGREPRSASLRLDLAGVVTDDHGYVPTDRYQRTNADGVFAVGDVTGRLALTPVAIAAGRRLADRLYGG